MMNARCPIVAVRGRADSPDETLYFRPIGHDPPCCAQDSESAPTAGTGERARASGGVPYVAGGQGRDAEEVGHAAMVIVWMFAAVCFWAIAAAVWWWLA